MCIDCDTRTCTTFEPATSAFFYATKNLNGGGRDLSGHVGYVGYGSARYAEYGSLYIDADPEPGREPSDLRRWTSTPGKTSSTAMSAAPAAASLAPSWPR